MFNHILVPMDFSAPSDAALECARAVAVQFAGSLHLLHVAEDPYRALYSAEVFVPEIEGLRDEILTDTTRRLNERLRPSDVTTLHDQIDRPVHPFERFRHGSCLEHRIAVLDQGFPQRPANELLVINDQHSGVRHDSVPRKRFQ